MVPSRRRSAPVLAASILLPVGLTAGVGLTVTATAGANEVSSAVPISRSVAAWPTEVEIPSTPAFSRFILTPNAGAGLAVYPTPDAAIPSQALPAVNELGSPLSLLALDRMNGRFQVLLPTRPNGATGWVDANLVTTSVPEYRVEISLSAHSLNVVRIADGAVMLTTAAGVGRPLTPTPVGEFFVRDHFWTGATNHPYGPLAIGLSGHSDVWKQFGTGDGRIAIHGTNDPATIGYSQSNGCIRVSNDMVVEIVKYLPLGAPVVITA